ncbi:MAG: helix-turn-helix domain-containing protein [Ruminococcus sp.]|nr:helix-turn-helix domain-containing protein [Ruminococcus sp.]
MRSTRMILVKFLDASVNRIESTNIELVYVLSGKLRAYVEDHEYILEQNEMIAINQGKNCELEISKNSIIAQLTIDFYYLYSQLDGKKPYIKCNSMLEEGEKYQQLRVLFQKLLLEYLESEDMDTLKYTTYSYQILLLLKESFLEQKDGVIGTISKEDRRLAFILDYIYLNYDQNISLSEISDELYMSVSALSRFFRKNTGQSFVNYVKQFRMQKVKEELEFSNHSITRIAVDNGFSNASVMNKNFKEEYGKTPSEYRVEIGEKKQKNTEELLRKKKKTIRELARYNMQKYEQHSEKIIQFDPEMRTGTFDSKIDVLNIGPAVYLINAELQRQTLMLWKDFRYSYVRIWNLFSKQVIMQSKDKKIINYKILDQILDFFVDNGMNVFFDLGRMTEITRENEKRLLFKKDEGILFKTEEEWREFLEHFLMHISERYGAKVVEKWIFEFSFFLNEQPCYQEGYRVKNAWTISALCTKKIIPNAKIAGPGLLGVGDKEATEMLIHDFLSASYQPDIFTSFHFPYSEKESGELKKVVQTESISEQIRYVKDALQKERFKGAFYATDWNCSVSNRSYIEDSCYRATFFMKTILHNRQIVDALGIWYASDLISNYGDSDNPVNGSGGILTSDGIKKPVYYALQMIGELGTQIIAEGENYIVTKKKEKDYQILCYNYLNLGPRYYLTEENNHEPEEIIDFFESGSRIHLNIQANKIPNGKYVIRQKILNEKAGGILQKWIKLGKDTELSIEDMEYLRTSSYPHLEKQKIYVDNGEIQIHISLQPNEVRLISIKAQY